ncbi:aldo/keto reductase [Agaribacter marinus]|uniref:Aldo/keto reductase n=1 Tax=Virgibacillus salarius TaxID=447199 RepID=A0A941ICS6_9BACI|nr:aldo/keto reductase [Virgibacillus salarius]MBR7797687.1 aldo/keto reductase [Virgibacillus salarius]NAZ10397.1 aldo/keto reductase [Agaribacter marinus]
MKKNQIGSSDIYISQLTLGCMSLGKDTAKAKSMIDMALEHGINHLDTADLYDFGDNEEIVGSAIKHRREDVVLTTKVGNHFNRETRKWYWDPSKEHIQQGVKASLKRLNTDYIDFYMLHGGTIDDPIDETIEAFEILKKEGLIRAYGISSIRPNVIREYVKRSAMDGIMMQYNLLDRRPEEEILDLLDENNISVLARGPLAKGMLSNQAAKQIAAKGETGYLDYSYKELQSINDELTKLSSNKNELSFRYILKHPAVASVVFGASSIDQLKENINGDFNKELQDDTYHNLKKITKPVTYQAHR